MFNVECSLKQIDCTMFNAASCLKQCAIYLLKAESCRVIFWIVVVHPPLRSNIEKIVAPMGERPRCSTIRRCVLLIKDERDLKRSYDRRPHCFFTSPKFTNQNAVAVAVAIVVGAVDAMMTIRYQGTEPLLGVLISPYNMCDLDTGNIILSIMAWPKHTL